MWPRRAHVLAPLSEMTGLGTFQWDDRKQKAFEEMKAIICADALNAYPDYSIPFHIYTDASDYQLGAAIIQNSRPIAYYSKKLTSCQKNYTTTEKELLAIVLTLRDYRKILHGAVIFIYTDHKNLTFKTFSVQRVLRWRLYIDEFDVTIRYIEGKKNVLADCFSRLPLMAQPSVGDRELQGTKGTLIDFNDIEMQKDTEEILEGETFFAANENEKLIECFLNLPPLEEMINPITIVNITNHQSRDFRLHQAVREDERYSLPRLHG